MAQLPIIHTIHASDAPQHVGKLKEIFQKLKAEHRIADFITLDPKDQLSSLTNQVQNNDLILTLLTHELEPLKQEIVQFARGKKEHVLELKMAEIIVDHVPYENEFITFPLDLRPIRDRQDMDAVWSDIEQSLKDMFPVQEIKQPMENIKPSVMQYVLVGFTWLCEVLYIIGHLVDRDHIISNYDIFFLLSVLANVLVGIVGCIWIKFNMGQLRRLLIIQIAIHALTTLLKPDDYWVYWDVVYIFVIPLLLLYIFKISNRYKLEKVNAGV